MVRTPSVAEITDIAGFETRVHHMAPIGDGDLIAPSCCDCAETGFLVRDDLWIASIAQHVEMGNR